MNIQRLPVRTSDTVALFLSSRVWPMLAVVLLLMAALPGTALAVDCTDFDSDGYAIEGGECGPIDCADNDADRSPGLPELCGDGIDNNCAGGVDEGFETLGDACVAATSGVGGTNSCTEGDVGCCATKSTSVCSANKLSLVCPLPLSGADLWEAEVANTATCFDFVDNNCNDLTDHADPVCQTAELCNNFDDDGDGSTDEDFALGGSCTSGVGFCARTGSSICSVDGTGTACSANPRNPRNETPAHGNSCSDGIDNDCDGTTDLFDPSCQTVEICDGIDNNGDAVVDEGFALGGACSTGLGACQANGNLICTADGQGTQCDTPVMLGVLEGPTGPTCSDGIDNDCDGFTDLDDPSCAASALTVSCSLPYVRGRAGRNCNAKSTIEYQVSGATGLTEVRAELLALGTNGEVLGEIAVEQGDVANLASRHTPEEFRLQSRTNRRDITTHTVHAPLPVLRVRVLDGGVEHAAYCSIVPFVDVTSPHGQVVSVSEGNVTRVTAAIPLVDPASLEVLVDGVDILDQLGLDPATDFPGGPYNGTVIIDSDAVEVIDLIVRGGQDLLPEGTNSLSMSLSDLRGGGHIVLVEGDPLPGTTACLTDDLSDTGIVSVLEVEILTPTDQEVTNVVPTPVTGEVRHGKEITRLRLNGSEVDVTGQLFFPGDGVTSADDYVLVFDEALPQTDLTSSLGGVTPQGTLDPGSNIVVADASDLEGNRAFDSRTFATGDVSSPTGPAAPITLTAESTISDPSIQEAFARDARRVTMPAFDEAVADAADIIDRAFVIGLEPGAIQNLFDKKCVQAGVEFADSVRSSILSKPNPPSKSVSGGCSCSPTVHFDYTNVVIDPNQVSCPVTFVNDKIQVEMNLPNVVVTATAKGSCKTEIDLLLGKVCTSKTNVNITATTTVSNLGFDFDITEQQLLGTAEPQAGVFIDGDVLTNTSGGVTIGCLASVCNWALEGLVTLFSFGTVDFDLSPQIDTSEVSDFTREIGSNEPDPISLDEIEIDEQVVEEVGQAAFAPTLSDVQITPSGLVAALSASFSTQVTDLEVEPTPGAVLSPASSPNLPDSDVKDAFVVLADDVFDQLYASMAQSGGLKTSCKSADKTVGDMLPTDCDSIDSGTEGLEDYASQGVCHGIRGVDCNTLLNEDFPSGSPEMLAATAVLQGACHGVSGDDCTFIPVYAAVLSEVEKGVCEATPDANLTASDPLLFCTRQDVPPQLILDDNPATTPIETWMLLNDMTVAMIVDRGDNGFDGELSSTPTCFGGEGGNLGDCQWTAACLDLNLESQMTLAGPGVCAANEIGFVTEVLSVNTSGVKAGVVCGAPGQTDDDTVTDTAAEDGTVDEIAENLDTFTPPMCAEGLTLGGLLNPEGAALISIKKEGAKDGFGDYLGITAEINP